MAQLHFSKEMMVISNLVREVELSFSAEYYEHTLHIQIDTDKLLKHIQGVLDLTYNEYKKSTGESHFVSNKFAENIKNSNIKIHFDDYVLEAKRKYKNETITKDLGYERIKNDSFRVS